MHPHHWLLLLLSPFLMIEAQIQLNLSHMKRIAERSQVPEQLYTVTDFEQLRNAQEIIGIENILGGMSADTQDSVSVECAADILLLQQSISKMSHSLKNMTSFDKDVTLNVIDSSGKPGSGVLRLHTEFMGLYDQCIKIDSKLEDRKRRFQGDYFRVSFDLLNTNCSSPISVDLCLPKSCTSKEIDTIIQNGDHGNMTCSVKNVNDAVPEKNAGTYIVASVMGVIAALAILSGLVDYFFMDILVGSPVSRTTGFRLFMSFSLYTNISQIMSYEGAGKNGQISPIHCIRFFSICWVIMGHLLIAISTHSANKLDVFSELEHVSFEFLTNAYFSVDSFFFMSGLLLAFIWFKTYKKNKNIVMSVQGWVMFYVHRILRLSPPYFIVVLFYTFVFLPMMHDQPTALIITEEDPCRKFWWTNLVYLNNFVHSLDQCYPVSWYLATDLQIHLFAPLVLIPLAIHMFFGIAVAGLIMALSIAANMYTVYHYYYPPIRSLGWSDPRMTAHDFEKYDMLVYDAPWIRCPPYIIGLVVGYLLQHRKSLSINKFLNFALWILSGVVMFISVLGLYRWNKQEWHMPLLWRAIYSTFAKFGWALGLTWIIISGYYGRGGFINRFMSLPMWIPFGRLTYCAYLTHMLVANAYFGLQKTEIFYNGFWHSVCAFYLPVISITYFLSVFWSALFELPFGKVESILLGQRRPEKEPVKKEKIDMKL